MHPVVIIGGGLSGLSTAYFLSKVGLPITLIERDSRLGGLIHTDYIDGFLIENGPDSWINQKPWARELAQELGLGNELIGCNDALRGTLIWKRGRFIRMPEGMRLMVPSEMSTLIRSPLLSLAGKLRASKDLFYHRPPEEEERSVAKFIRDHFGQEAVDYLAEPLLAGVYGGDPEKLSASSVLPQFVEWECKYGSLIRAARNEPLKSSGPIFGSMRRGLGALVEALVAQTRMNVIRGAAEKLEKGWRVRVNGEWLDASHVVVACPPETVLPNLFPPVEYSSSTVVALAFNREAVPHPLDAFGFLVPKRERKSVTACTFVGSKWPDRVPEGKALLRCFVTGNVSDVRGELAEKLGIRAEPLFERIWPWPNSMPQYTIGHAARIELVEGMLRDLPGLHLAGNSYYGIGMPDCVRLARVIAERIANECLRGSSATNPGASA